MKRLCVILSISALCMSCSSEKPKYTRTYKVSENLYIETYQIHFGGVLDGDSFIAYLTDSMYFRKELGDFDDNDWPDAVVTGDRIKIKWDDFLILRKRVYFCNIKKLKRNNKDDYLHKKYCVQNLDSNCLNETNP